MSNNLIDEHWYTTAPMGTEQMWRSYLPKEASIVWMGEAHKFTSYFFPILLFILILFVDFGGAMGLWHLLPLRSEKIILWPCCLAIVLVMVGLTLWVVQLLRQVHQEEPVYACLTPTRVYLVEERVLSKQEELAHLDLVFRNPQVFDLVYASGRPFVETLVIKPTEIELIKKIQRNAKKVTSA